MASIGQAALVLSTQSASLYSGLDKGAKDSVSWVGTVNQSILGAFNSTRVRLAAVWAAITGSAIYALKKINDRVKELTDVGRKATRLGIAPELFMGVSQQAQRLGVDVDALNIGLTKLGAHLAEPDAAFAKEIQKLGLSLHDLQGKDVGSAFLDISTAIKALPSPAQQAAAAIGLFSKQAVGLLPILQQGGDAIQRFAANQANMGLALNASQMAALERAREVIPRLSALWEGFKNTMLVAFAPVLELINGALTDALKGIQPHLNDIAASFLTVAYVAAKGFAYMSDAFNVVVGGIIYGAGLIEEAFARMWVMLANGFAKLATMGGALAPMFKKMAIDFAGFGVKDGKQARDWQNIGKEMINGWGHGAKAIDDWLEKMIKRRQEIAKPVAIGGVAQQINTDPIGAAIKGSKEAFDIESRFRTNSKIQAQDRLLNAANKQVNLLQRGNDIADKIRENTEQGQRADIGVV